MSAQNFYNLCQQYMNRPVEITCLDGTVHRGIVSNVDEGNVWLRPLDGGGDGADGFDGPGVFYWGWGWGWGWPIALASIAAIAAIGFW